MTHPRNAPPRRGFDTAEYRARTHKAQALMQEQDLAGLLLTTEPDVRYFSGFHTAFWQSPTRPWFLFVPADGAPIAIIPEIGADLMRSTWVEDVRTWSAPSPGDDGISLLTDLLMPLSNARQKLGVMAGHETHLRMPLNDWQRLLSAVPGVQIADATRLVQGLRMVKSEAEIEKLRYICALGSATFEDIPNHIQAGAPLDQVFRHFRQSALRQGVDDAPYVVGGAAPGGYRDVISPPTARPLASGDILMIDSGCTWDGYFCDFDRNWAIGEASEDAQRAYDVLWRATEAGIDAARPGRTCSDVFRAISSVIKEMDVSGGDIGRLGHGLGMQLTEQPSIAGSDDTQLVEDMVLTIEPSLSYGGSQMMVHEENIVVTRTGARLLTRRAPADLPVI